MSILSNMIISGIVNPYLILGWQDSAYIVNLKKEFERLHVCYKEQCVSEVGVLILSEEDSLVPKYFLKLKDGTIKEITYQTDPIALSDLIHDSEKIEEIKKEGWLVVVKYNNEC